MISYGKHKINLFGREMTIDQYREMIGDSKAFPMPEIWANGTQIHWIFPKQMIKSRWEETTEDIEIDEDGNRCCVMCGNVLNEEYGDSENICAKCN